MSTAATFSEWLKRRRRTLGLTQDLLARRVGCATITIQKLEAGDLRPSVQIAERLADQLELASDERLDFLAAARMGSLTPRTSDHSNTMLPEPHTPLIGREPFVAAVCATLQRAGVRLVTLTGPPGVGKTRVALQVAHDLHPTIRDGALFISLASIHDPDLVLASIAQALDLPEAAHQSYLTQLTAALYARECFLVLDNFEQVVAGAPALSALLEAVPGLKVLITSRAPLHISGEYLLPLPPLALPDLHNLPPLGALAQVPAVALFVQRAQAAVPDFALTEMNAADVAAICQRLDGLPLALELAAARSTLFAPQALLARLQNPLTVLTVGARNLPRHQQTLRSTIAWSYDLLSSGEQMLFGQLGIFVSGFTFDAVTEICRDVGDGSFDVLDGLACLVDHSLVQPELHSAGERRFRLLETIRDYAQEQLVARSEVDLLRERHARYYVRLAEQAESELHGPRQVIWFERLEHEHDNIRAALTWSLQHGAPDIGFRLASALWWFWPTYGHVREGYQWFERFLPQIDAVAPVVQCRGLLGAAGLAWYQGRFEQSSALARQMVVLSRTIGDTRATGLACTLLAVHAAYRSEIAEAAEWYQQSLALLREIDDPWGFAVALEGQGVAAFNVTEFDHAEEALTEALALFRGLGDALHGMYGSVWLGLTLVRKGAYHRADQVLKEGLGVVRVLGTRVSIPESLDGLAATAVALNHIERAIQLTGAADALRERVGSFMSPGVQSIRADYLARARSELDEVRFAKAWEAGRAMSLERAIEFALGSHEMETAGSQANKANVPQESTRNST